jgi:hypothetical protein
MRHSSKKKASVPKNPANLPLPGTEASVRSISETTVSIRSIPEAFIVNVECLRPPLDPMVMVQGSTLVLNATLQDEDGTTYPLETHIELPEKVKGQISLFPHHQLISMVVPRHLPATP